VATPTSCLARADWPNKLNGPPFVSRDRSHPLERIRSLSRKQRDAGIAMHATTGNRKRNERASRSAGCSRGELTRKALSEGVLPAYHNCISRHPARSLVTRARSDTDRETIGKLSELARAANHGCIGRIPFLRVFFSGASDLVCGCSRRTVLLGSKSARECLRSPENDTKPKKRSSSSCEDLLRFV